jgi:hypothetical protein
MWRRFRSRASARVARLGLVVLAAATGLAGGYIGGQSSVGETTTISFAACGVAPVPAIGSLPLAPFRGQFGVIPLSIGPVRLAHYGEPVLVRFVEVERLEDKRPVKRDGVITLPLLASANRPPDEIRIKCRYGEVAGVTYHYAEQTVSLVIPSS